MRLDIGSGGILTPGWVHLDRVDPRPVNEQTNAEPLFVLHDLRKPLPFLDATVEMAVAHHVVDLLTEPDLHALCAEMFRVLEPDATWRISNVDYKHAVCALVQRDVQWFSDLGVPVHETLAETFMWYLTWGGARQTVLYCPEQLGLKFLAPAGFSWEVVAFEETTCRKAAICDLDTRQGESWFAEARRPE